MDERRNCLRHGDGQGYQQRKWQQYPYYLTAVGNTLYFEANDGTNGYELWKSDGTASGTVMVKDITAEAAAVLPTTSQPLATPSISKPTTEPTDTNCGRAMELPQAR